MAVASLDVSKCDRSPGCPSRRVCPHGAIQPIEGGRYPGSEGYKIIEELCTGCGACVRVCGGRAISIDE